jgi:uncharacterized protein
MITLDTLRHEKRPEILRLAQAHGARNVRVLRANSDVDFLVDLESGRSLLDLGGLLTDLEVLLGANVDVVESESIHPYVRSRVLAEAIPH